MARLMDFPLDEIRKRLFALVRRVDDLVSNALIAIKDPMHGLSFDADLQDEEVNRLEKELQAALPAIFTRYQPVARDHRFLFAVMVIPTDLEHMGDCAKHICRIAWEIGVPSKKLLVLFQKTQARTIDCFRILHKMELAEIELAEKLAAGRQEVEEAFEQAVEELEMDGLGQLSTREFGHQLLVALDLRRICDYTASIADQIIYCKTGVRRLAR